MYMIIYISTAVYICIYTSVLYICIYTSLHIYIYMHIYISTARPVLNRAKESHKNDKVDENPCRIKLHKVCASCQVAMNFLLLGHLSGSCDLWG